MAVLSALVGLIGVVVLFDLFLSFAVIRRLRIAPPTAIPPGVTLTPVGTRIPEFTATTHEGELLTEASLASGSTLIAFVSVDCDACVLLKDKLQASPPLGDVLFFVHGAFRDGEPAPAAGDFISGFAELGEVVPLDITSTLKDTFEVGGFPTLLRVIDGTVVASGFTLRDIGLYPTRQIGAKASAVA